MTEPIQIELFAKQAAENFERRLPSGDWVTVSDVSSALNYSLSEIYTWIDAGLVVSWRATDSGMHKIFRPSVVSFFRTRMGL